MHLLEERLTDALHDAAVHLAVQDQRIDRPSGVVDRAITRNADGASVGIDLDLADRAAGRIGWDATGECLFGLQRLAAAERRVVAYCLRDIGDGQTSVAGLRCKQAI